MNVATIIVGDVGYAMYKNQIESSQFMFADNENELLSCINKPTCNEGEYIVDDVSITRNLMMRINAEANK